MASLSIGRLSHPAHKPAKSLNIRSKLRDLMHGLEMARMTHVLNNLSDEHLRQIGIARHEIPAYATRCLQRDS